MWPPPQSTDSTANEVSDATVPEVEPLAAGMTLTFPHLFTLFICIDIELGALYDPRLPYDYGGSIFYCNHAKLVRCSTTDTAGSLIPPWSEYDNLRTGTVVFIRVPSMFKLGVEHLRFQLW